MVSQQLLTAPDDFPPLTLPGVDFSNWRSWPAHRRVSAIRRWVTYAGPVDRWAQRFDEEWEAVGRNSGISKQSLFCSARQRVKLGWCALDYLERAMEGELPSSTDDLRDLYVQAQQLSKQLCMAVGGLDSRLESISLTY